MSKMIEQPGQLDVKKESDTLLEENFNLILELDRFNSSLIDKSQRKDIDNQIVEDLTVSPI
jgi:hypothetical protein